MAPFAPYLAVIIGLFAFDNAWVAVFGYHAMMALVLKPGAVLTCRRGDYSETFGRGDFFGEVSILLGEPPTADIVAATPLAQSTVSQHLKVLRDAGLIQGEIEGPATCYCLDPEGLGWLRTHFADWASRQVACCPAPDGAAVKR